MAGRWAPIKKRSFSLRRGGLHGLICIREVGVWVLCEAVCVIKSGGAAFKRCCIIQFSSTSTSKQHVVCWLKWCCRSYAPTFQVSGWWDPEPRELQLRSFRQASSVTMGNVRLIRWSSKPYTVQPCVLVLCFNLKYMFFQPLYRSPSELNIEAGSVEFGLLQPHSD